MIWKRRIECPDDHLVEDDAAAKAEASCERPQRKWDSVEKIQLDAIDDQRTDAFEGRERDYRSGLSLPKNGGPEEMLFYNLRP